jgi:hypothetical protein
MFLHVLSVRPVGGFRLHVDFDNGSLREVDLEKEIHGEIFGPLRSPAFFATAFVNPETGTVEWPNGADFAPEFLYRIGREVQRVA